MAKVPQMQAMQAPFNRLKTCMQWPRNISKWRRAMYFVLHQGCLYVLVMMVLTAFDGLSFTDHMENFVSMCIMTCCQLKSLELLYNIQKLEEAENILVNILPNMEQILIKQANSYNNKTEKKIDLITKVATRAFYPVIFPVVFIPLYGFFFQAPHERLTMGMTPMYVRKNDFLFVLTALENCVVLAAALLFNAAFDSILVSLMLYVKCKSQILIEVLKYSRFDVDEEDRATRKMLHYNLQKGEESQAAVLKFCSKYHRIILKLYQDSVEISRRSPFFMCVYLCFCLIMPGISITTDNVAFGRVAFSAALGLHGFSEILLFCFTAEEVLQVSEEITFAVYDAYDPSFTKSKSKQILLLIMIRAQKPLRYKPGGLISLQKSTFLHILRRTYSLYSFLYNFA